MTVAEMLCVEDACKQRPFRCNVLCEAVILDAKRADVTLLAHNLACMVPSKSLGGCSK